VEIVGFPAVPWRHRGALLAQVADTKTVVNATWPPIPQD
jgi:hypothetical protein